MSAPPPTPDGRPLTDRLIARIRDNRIAAGLIIASMLIGGLASLGDATRKVADWLPGPAAPSVAGPWKTGEIDWREAGPEYLRLDLQEGPAGQIRGDLQFGGTDRLPARRIGLLEGRRDGRHLSLRYDTGRYVIASGGTTRILSETLVGEIGPDELRLRLQIGERAGVAVVARRIEPSAQRLAGRLALTYDGQVFDDHRSACKKVLSGLSPPETYVRSEPPTDTGSVRCIGARPDGRVSFDMHDAGIRLDLICPPRSRPLPEPIPGERSLDRCECDGDLQARAGACVAAPDPLQGAR